MRQRMLRRSVLAADDSSFLEADPHVMHDRWGDYAMARMGFQDGLEPNEQIAQVVGFTIRSECVACSRRCVR